MMRASMIALATVLIPITLKAEDAPPLGPRCEALYREFTELERAFSDATRRARTSEEARSFSGPDRPAYAARFLAMARERPDDPAAVDALVHAILVDPFGPTWGEAIDRLKADHVASPRIAPVLRTIALDMSRADIEPFLRSVLERNAAIRDEAAYALGRHLLRHILAARSLEGNPEGFRRMVEAIGEPATIRMRDRDRAALRREAEALFKSVVANRAREPVGRSSRLGDLAEAELRELQELVVGKEAPEIEGADVDGRPIKLSDYRGKVVVLSWWATWCGPCMALIPHEKDLIRRMEGKPFVLLGINGDEDRDRMRHRSQEEGITWRSWYDDGPNGKISTRWNVHGWPTVYVIDASGVIRYKGHRNEAELDAAVERLLPQID